MRACQVSTQKVGIEDIVQNNNELRGHMIPVPVSGCVIVPLRQLLCRVVNHLNNVGHCLPQPRSCISIPQGGPTTLSILSGVHPSCYPFLFGFLFQISVSLGQL